MMRLPERFQDKISPEPNSGCWLWVGAQTKGYGVVKEKGQQNGLAHRVVYELLKEKIAKGLDLNHICRVRCCVNPNHNEPATRRVSLLRGIGFPATQAAQTECLRGHPLSGSNLYVRPSSGSRCCKTCHNEGQQRYRKLQKERGKR